MRVQEYSVAVKSDNFIFRKQAAPTVILLGCTGDTEVSLLICSGDNILTSRVLLNSSHSFEKGQIFL